MTTSKRTPSKTSRMLRQASGRYESRLSLSGREKRRTRHLPSLPRLKCLEIPELGAQDEKPTMKNEQLIAVCAARMPECMLA